MSMSPIRLMRRIANAAGAAIKRPDKGPVAVATDTARFMRYMGGIADRSWLQSASLGELTPTRVMAILRAADAGDIYQQCELFEEMEERDSEIGAHLQTRKLGLLACGYEIQPPDDSPEAQRACELCDEILGAVPALEDRLFDLLDAIGKGFAVCEIRWDTARAPWRPAALEARPQRWFVLGPDGNELRLADPKSVEGIALNPLNFIIHRHHARSGSLPRAGLLRGIVRPFIVRNYGWKDWLAFGEMFGQPTRIGTLPAGATAEQQTALWDALKNLASDYCAMVSEGTKIEFLEAASKGSATIYERMIAAAGTDLTLAILGQTLTSGGQEGGSYALGKIHQNVRYDLLDSDARRLAETLEAQLLAPIVRFNLGEDAPIPKWHWNLELPEDLPQLANTVKTLRDAGLPITRSWVYEKFGIPEPTEGEPVMELPAGVGEFGGDSAGVSPAMNAVANAARPRRADVQKKKPTPNARYIF